MTKFLKIIWPQLVLLLSILIFQLNFDLVGWSFLISAVSSGLMLGISSLRQVNSLTIYALFAFIFLGVIPWLHYTADALMWLSSSLPSSTLFFVNFAVFISNNLVVIFHFIGSRSGRRINASHVNIRRPALTKLALLLLSFTGFVLVLYINSFNFILLFFRGIYGIERELAFDSSAARLLIGMVARLLPAFALFFAVTEIKGSRIFKLSLFVLLLLSVFPTGVARFLVAFVYVPLILLLIPKMRSGVVFSGGLIFALLMVFPFLDQFRNYTTGSSIRLIPSEEFFFLQHFDAYENFASAVDANFVSYGSQLFGSLLFFVPRSIWPDKPLGSGYVLAQELVYTWSNISMPFLGEGYVNFGFFGVFIFAAFLGFTLGNLDRKMAVRTKSENEFSYRTAVYFFLLSALFFLLRGDLLSSFAFLCAGFVVSKAVEIIVRFLNAKLAQ